MTRTEKLLAELIALPSVNPAFAPPGLTQPARAGYGEKNVADFLAVVAARAGLEVELQPVLPADSKRWGERTREPKLGAADGSRVRSPHQNDLIRSNVIARLLPPGKIRQTILLAPHLDTVGANDAQFVPRRKNGRIYGRGACDTKGSVAAMLTTLCELADTKSRPRETQIVFAGLVDEENAQIGSRALAASGLQADLAIVGEPTRLQVITAHKGSLWLQLETRGKAVHGATPQLGRNAVHEMARVVDLLETDYAARLRRRRHPLLGPPTVNTGMISGGAQPNIVPDCCIITIDRRTLPGETEAGVCREITALLRAKKLSAKITSKKFAPCLPMETNPKLPLVRQFLRSVGQTRPAGVDFFCDAAVLAEGGISSVVFGPGDIAQAHTADEWISLESLERGKNMLLAFLKSLP
jgi:succinyl-diaminopimelate desuccinylase